MVNPNKFKNNLNEKDFYYILDYLNKEYDKTDDETRKKKINQVRMIMLFANLKFTIHDITDMPTEVMYNSKMNDTLRSFIFNHVQSNFCQINGLLFTDDNNKPLNEEDINLLLNNVKIPNFDKEISYTKLSLLSTKYNKHGSKSIDKGSYRDKMKIKKAMNEIKEIKSSNNKSNTTRNKLTNITVKSKDKKLKNTNQSNIENNDMIYIKKNLDNITQSIDKFKNDDLININKNMEYISEYYNGLNDKIIDNTNSIDKINKQIDDVLCHLNKIYDIEDYLNNKVTKINKQMKNIDLIESSLNKISDEINDFKNYKFENEDMNTILYNIQHVNSNVHDIKDNITSDNTIDEYSNRINEKLDRIIDYITKIQNNLLDKRNTSNQNISSNNENKLIKHDKKIISSTPTLSDITINSHKYEENRNYKSFSPSEFLYNWIKTNIMITKNIHDNINSDEILENSKRYAIEHNIKITGEITFSIVEDSLKKYYDRYNNKLSTEFSDIINEHTDGTYSFSNMKFGNDSQNQRDNKFKNIIMEWLKIKVEKTNNKKDMVFNEYIVQQLIPLFERQGWLFVEKDRLEEAKNLKIPVCDTWTFSQIVGKAMKAVYRSVFDNKIVKGNKTRYPGIKIKHTESKKFDKMVKEELSNPLIEYDGIIYNWLNDNLIYSGDSTDKLIKYNIYNKFNDYLTNENIQISENLLKKAFKHDLNEFYEEKTNKTCSNEEIIQGFIWKDNSQNRQNQKLIQEWISIYLEKTSTVDDTITLDEIKEKILYYLSKYNLTVVDSEIYHQLPSYLKSKFILNYSFNNIIKNRLRQEYEEIVRNNQVYYTNIKFIKFKIITENTINNWIHEHINIIKDMKHIESQSDILNLFIENMKENKYKNIYEIDIGEKLNNNISKYYFDSNNKEIKIINDDDTYYTSIELI